MRGRHVAHGVHVLTTRYRDRFGGAPGGDDDAVERDVAHAPGSGDGGPPGGGVELPHPSLDEADPTAQHLVQARSGDLPPDGEVVQAQPVDESRPRVHHRHRHASAGAAGESHGERGPRVPGADDQYLHPVPRCAHAQETRRHPRV